MVFYLLFFFLSFKLNLQQNIHHTQQKFTISLQLKKKEKKMGKKKAFTKGKPSGGAAGKKKLDPFKVSDKRIKKKTKPVKSNINKVKNTYFNKQNLTIKI